MANTTDVIQEEAPDKISTIERTRGCRDRTCLHWGITSPNGATASNVYYII